MIQRFFFALIPVALVSFANASIAQESQWEPAGVPAFQLHHVVVAKTYKRKDSTQVLGVIRFEYRTQEVPYTEMSLETRTRETIDPKTGNASVQEYTVQVPVQKTRTEVSVARKRFEVPVKHIKVWRFDGEALGLNESLNALASPKRCFLMTTPYQRSIEDPVDGFYSKMFQENVFVVWYDPKKAIEINAGPKD